MSVNTIWIASVPRTGSMWTTNIIREIFFEGNLNVFPKDQIQSDKEILEYYNSEVQLDENNLNKFVLKIHRKLTILPPRSKIITNIRNPFDICASHNEFMKCDLDKSISVASDLSNWIKYYKNLFNDVFLVKYEDIENRTNFLIQKLSEFCEVKLSEMQIQNIIKKYSKNKVMNLIKNNDEAIKTKIKKKETVDEKKIVRFRNGSYRSFDINTGFQTGHVSQRKSGEWKKVFSAQEINIIIEKLDSVAVELGYSSEKK